MNRVMDRYLDDLAAAVAEARAAGPGPAAPLQARY